MSKNEYRQHVFIMGAGLLVLGLLIGLTIVQPPGLADLVPGLIFCALIVFTMTCGVPLAEGSVSLMPMTVAAAYLVVGLVPAGWVTFIAVLIHGWIRYHWSGQFAQRQEPGAVSVITRTATNTVMHTVGILAGGAIFQLLGGATPLTEVDVSTILRLVVLGLTFLSVNYLIAGIYLAAQGRDSLRSYLRSLHKITLFEGAPLAFAVLMALTYTQLGLAFFILLFLNLVVGSLISYNLDLTNRRLGRRVKELDGLQAVGQALSASLDIENVVSAIYTQVAALMPAHEFHVALYDPQTEEVSFPLAITEGNRVHWRSRRAGNGLTEHVLHSRAPLLIRGDVHHRAAQMGLEQIGREAACWLGVPILAGAELLGVIAVQSHVHPRVYDSSHQDVLQAIAVQAAVAIHNARLYARTDESLSRRVQELDSILRTTHDGLLLLDLDWRVLAINRMLADWVNVAQSELVGRPLDTPLVDSEPLIALIGYTPNGLSADCEVLAQGEWTQKEAMVLLGPSMRHVERTMIPVRGKDGAISGWLLAFRDMTEEIELARLKDDMTEMLVHDLRSPLTAVIGSVEMMQGSFDARDEKEFELLQRMARHNSDRILHIVNQLLDISKLESGQLLPQPEVFEVKALFSDAQARFAPLAAEAQIQLAWDIAPEPPLLYIDPPLISRVLDNLLDNAIKFTPDGGRIRLWSRLENDQAAGELLVGVSDTGPGIPAEQQSRLFGKFQQVSATMGRRRGSGLGLAFCKLAVEAHGGRIWVESEMGKGSTFVMALPTIQGHAQ